MTSITRESAPAHKAIPASDFTRKIRAYSQHQWTNRSYVQSDRVREMMMQAAAEIDRLRADIAAIQQATLDGVVCDDIAWFSSIETLHDFCEASLAINPDQAPLPGVE